MPFVFPASSYAIDKSWLQPLDPLYNFMNPQLNYQIMKTPGENVGIQLFITFHYLVTCAFERKKKKNRMMADNLSLVIFACFWFMLLVSFFGCHANDISKCNYNFIPAVSLSPQLLSMKTNN